MIRLLQMIAVFSSLGGTADLHAMSGCFFCCCAKSSAVAPDLRSNIVAVEAAASERIKNLVTTLDKEFVSKQQEDVPGFSSLVLWQERKQDLERQQQRRLYAKLMVKRKVTPYKAVSHLDRESSSYASQDIKWKGLKHLGVVIPTMQTISSVGDLREQSNPSVTEVLPPGERAKEEWFLADDT